MKIHLVDAFTDKAFAGNPAAVVLLDSEPTDFDWMQSIGMEMNQSETAFVWPLHNDSRADWGLRWFTPTVEIPLCGHATLASAHILWQEGLVKESVDVRFCTPMAGHYLICSKSVESGVIRMSFPAVATAPAQVPVGLPEALGVQPKFCGRTDSGMLFLQLESAEEVRAAKPDFRAMVEVTKDVVILSAQSDQIELDVVSRFFAPAKGINEDPVTGAAHCVLAPWWGTRLKQKTLRCYQASARGGHLFIELEGDRVFLSGYAITLLSGEWKIEPQSK